MSCFVVDDKVINSMISFYKRKSSIYYRYSDKNRFCYSFNGTFYEYDLGSIEDCQKLAELFFKENVRSFSYRYSGRYDDENEEVNISFKEEVIDLAQFASNIQCYEYQSCETNDWRDTEAYRALSVFKNLVVESVQYGHEPVWGM